MLSGDQNDQSVSRQAWELVYSHAAETIATGHSVIIDAVHKSREQRRRDVLRYRGYGAHAVAAVHVTTSLETALARNASRQRVVPDEVILNMHETLLRTPPDVSDGYDFVIRLTNE